MFRKNRRSQKFCKSHKKTPVLESLFNKVTGLRPPSYVFNIIFLMQVENYIASYYSAPTFLEDFLMNAPIFPILLTLT